MAWPGLRLFGSRWRPPGPPAEIQQKQPAHQPQFNLPGQQQAGERRQSESSDATIERIGAGCAQSGQDARPAPMGQRALDAQQADRSHRRRNGESDQHPFKPERHVKLLRSIAPDDPDSNPAGSDDHLAV